MAIWVKLKSVQYIEKLGKSIKHQPGDWVKVHKNQALLWEATGQAEIPSGSIGDLLKYTNAGIIITNNEDVGVARLDQYVGHLSITTGDPKPLYDLNLIWNPSAFLRLELLPAGYSLIEKWDLACPIFSYDHLACHEGDESDREYTQSIIRDLRVPLYDTRLIFTKRNPTTERLFATFLQERERGSEMLAFLRCVYEVKPLILALPITWTNQDVE